MNKLNKREIAVFTGNRAEYGLLFPVIRELSGVSALGELYLIISGAHLNDDFGKTIDEIDMSCVKDVKKINLPRGGVDKQLEALQSFSRIISDGAEILTELRPAFIVLAGDRYETFAMAIVAFYMNIPIVHLFGGDLSRGGHLDDSVRHCITKLAHIHFTTNADSYKRILGLGEEEWRVFNVGSTAIDNVMSGGYSTIEDLSRNFEIDLGKPIILFTQHPVTTEIDFAYAQVKESLEALKELGYQTIITYPCNDPGSDKIIEAINEYSDTPHFFIRKNLGWKDYLGFLKIASVVVGNSSSGIMETPVFKVGCVNIGKRQEGRLRSENVVDVGYNKSEIKKAINTVVTDKEFMEKLKTCSNPYGSGGASQKIVEVLSSISFDRDLLQKKMTF